jgi:hypothetical protein
MTLNSLRAATVIAICFACVTAQMPLSSAQVILGPATYQQTKLPGGDVRYTDQEMGVSFTLTPDWRLANDGTRWLDRGWNASGDADKATTVLLHHGRLVADLGLYYRIAGHPIPMAPYEIDRVLAADANDKISQRQIQQGYKDYRIRALSFEREEIGGQRALACVADFTEGNNRMVEYLVWVRSEKTLAEFFIKAPASELLEVREEVEPIIQSLRIQ